MLHHPHHRSARHPLHHVEHLPVGVVSKLVPFSALIFSVILIVCFLLKHYLLEPTLFPRLYGNIYRDLDVTNRRGLVNHHVAGSIKILALIVGIYPFLRVACTSATFHTPYAKGSIVTLGDVLLVVSQLVIAMYAFELIYRINISPIGVMHHIGTILIGQSTLILSFNPAHRDDAGIEFFLCLLWGVFDVIAEFYPHVAITLYRIYPNDHRFLRRVFKTAFISTFLGTVGETIVVMFVFGSLWNRWTISFKLVTPILHCLFSFAQLHGTRVFYIMMRKQEELLLQEKSEKPKSTQVPQDFPC